MARKVGKEGAVYLGSPLVKVADIYDWAWEAATEMLGCDIKMDAFSRFTPSHGNARFTAKRRLNTTALLTKEVFDSANNGEQLAFRLDLIDNDNTLSQISGTGYVSSGSVGAPRDAISDEFEITVDGDYTVTTPGAS